MNKNLLKKEVQSYLHSHLNADTNKVALSKSPFSGVSALELANQLTARKKSEKKLPTWFGHKNIVYPGILSVEQTSSEGTALYKSQLAIGNTLADLTAGFGVDSYYFSKIVEEVISCELNAGLAEINHHNTQILGAENIRVVAEDGLDYLKNSPRIFDTIYLDPARRRNNSKVFKLADCTPNVVEHLDLLLQKSKRILLKTSPLLDIHAGLAELRKVAEIHILSARNECKELLWVLEPGFQGETKLICATLNEQIKTIHLELKDDVYPDFTTALNQTDYLYEPDAALMKSGAFNTIAKIYGLRKLDKLSHLYAANTFKVDFPGRIFKIKDLISPAELKKHKNTTANIIVRNFPEKAEVLAQKYKIVSAKDNFLLFTTLAGRHIVIKAEIIQYY